MTRKHGDAGSLTKMRRVGLGFGVFGLLLCGLQLDRGLPTYRVLLSFSALLLLLSVMVLVWRRRAITWPAVLASGPLLVLVGSGLPVLGTATAMALGVMASQSLYGSRRMAVVRAVSLAGVVPSLVLLRLSTGTPQALDPGIIAPVLVPTMFGILLRTLYNSFRQQETVSAREALLARYSQELLGVSEVAAARHVTSEAVAALCTMTAGVGLLTLRLTDDRASVSSACGAVPTMPGAIDADLVRAVTTRTSLSELHLSDEDLRALFGRNAAHLLATGLGIDATEVLLVASETPLPDDVRSVLNTLTAQLALVEATCRSHAELVTLAHHDALTAIPNRRAFFRLLADAVDSSKGHEDRVGLMIIDLDDFKNVNDSLGHAAGDHVLVEVARRMSALAAERGVPGRFGGDEFALLLADVAPADVDGLADDLRDSLLQPMSWQGEPLSVGASIGVTNGVPGATAGDLMRCADVAMYSAKALGKNRVLRFSEQAHGAVAELRTRQEHVPFALARREFVLRYSPLVDVVSRGCVGLELLFHWEHPSLGPLPPAAILPAAVRSGLFADVFQYVLTTACADLVAQQEPALHLAVDVYPEQLRDSSLADVVAQALQASGLPADRLVLQLTDAGLLGEPRAVRHLRELHRLGVGLALNGFPDALVPLAELPWLALSVKIDCSRLGQGDRHHAEDVLGMLVAVAKVLALTVTAAGVESEEDLVWASDRGITQAQGPLLGPPLAPEDLAGWLAASAGGVRAH